MTMRRGLCCNGIRHNRELYSDRLIKDDRVERFEWLTELSEKDKHVNQYK